MAREQMFTTRIRQHAAEVLGTTETDPDLIDIFEGPNRCRVYLRGAEGDAVVYVRYDGLWDREG